MTGLAHAGSQLGFGIVSTAALTHLLTRPWIDMQAQVGAPWPGTLDDPAGFLAGRQWDATLTPPGEPAARYGRWPFPVLPPGLPGAPRTWFVTARSRGYQARGPAEDSTGAVLEKAAPRRHHTSQDEPAALPPVPQRPSSNHPRNGGKKDTQPR